MKRLAITLKTALVITLPVVMALLTACHDRG